MLPPTATQLLAGAGGQIKYEVKIMFRRVKLRVTIA